MQCHHFCIATVSENHTFARLSSMRNAGMVLAIVPEVSRTRQTPFPDRTAEQRSNCLTMFSKIGHQKTDVLLRQSSVAYSVGPERNYLWTAAQKTESGNLFGRTSRPQRPRHVFREAIEPRNMWQAPLDHGIEEITNPTPLWIRDFLRCLDREPALQQHPNLLLRKP